jgi:hypothetical protein
MATLADKLTLQVAATTYKDMLEMVESEKRMRKDLLDGVSCLLFYFFLITKKVGVSFDKTDLR